MLRLRASAWLLLAVVIGSACGESARSTDVSDETRVEPLPVNITLRLRGDLNLTMENRVVQSTYALVRRSAKDQRNEQIIGVEFVEPTEVGGNLLKAGFAISPFEGDKKYTVKAGSPSDAPKEEEEAQRTGTPRSRSSMKVEWWPTTDVKGDTQLFWRRLEPCKATAEDNARRGRFYCPAVSDEGRTKQFSFEFIWSIK